MDPKPRKQKPLFTRLFGAFEGLVKPVDAVYKEPMCKEVRTLLETRRGPKIQLERFIKDCCAFIYFYRQDYRGLSLRTKLYSSLTFTHIGEDDTKYANEHQLLEYISNALELLKAELLEEPESTNLHDLEEELVAHCLEARLVDALGILNRKHQVVATVNGENTANLNFNTPEAAQYKTQGAELIATLLDKKFYDENMSKWGELSGKNAVAAAKSAGATDKQATEGAALISKRTPANKDYTSFILSRLANVLETMEANEAEHQNFFDQLSNTGVGTDVATLQEIFKRKYLKIPAFFFEQEDQKEVVIEALLKYYQLTPDQKTILHNQLSTFVLESLQGKLDNLQGKSDKLKGKLDTLGGGRRSRKQRKHKRTRTRKN
jgi:hypothetical protein